jgi:hypothetical protein
MPEDEQFQWNLIFGEDKEITLPNVNVLKNIPLINLKTAKICLNKNLIEKKRSITLKSKYIEWIFVIVSILRFLSVFLMNRLQEQMQGKLSDWILI